MPELQKLQSFDGLTEVFSDRSQKMQTDTGKDPGVAEKPKFSLQYGTFGEKSHPDFS